MSVMNVFRENATEGRKIDVLQLMLDASEVTQSSEADTVSTKKLLSDDEIVANSWIFLLGHFQSPYFRIIKLQVVRERFEVSIKLNWGMITYFHSFYL